MIPKLLLRQEAADRMGLHFAKLERLRKAGLIPEAVQAGRFFLYPADQLNDIRTRLVTQGHIKTAQGALAHVA